VGFLRVVEVFPPLFPSEPKGGPIDVQGKVQEFVEGVREIRKYADLILVANLKNPDLLRFSTVEAAIMLQERLGVKASPVVVVRDMNRLEFLSTVLTCISAGLPSTMIAWGDKHPRSANSSNVRDFPTLSSAIEEASKVRARANSKIEFLAPVDIGRLGRAKGTNLAKERVRSGAGYLLAQPPTTDPEGTFESHSLSLIRAGLKDRVLLNVFPFRDAEDVAYCERHFGWRLPSSIHKAAESGSGALLEMEREVVQRSKEEGHPGVYVSTRGEPSWAQRILS
jgi:hypothetical protein